MKKWIQAIIIALCFLAMGFAGCSTSSSDVKFRAKELYYSRSSGTYIPVSNISLVYVDSAFRVGDTVQFSADGIYLLTEKVK